MRPASTRSGVARRVPVAPKRVDRDLASLHLEVFSIKRAANKLKFLAGSESGMGAFVNDVAPERTAAMLRDALAR